MTVTLSVPDEMTSSPLPISSDEKTTILINVESAVKELASALAKKQEIPGVNIDNEIASALPNSLTGVMVYYFCKGIKNDFGIEFAEKPVSLKQRGGGSKFDKKVAGKKRLLTREQKNELLNATKMEFYDERIRTGVMTIDNAMYAIKDAYERVKNFEEMGYLLPPKKTEYPYWVDEVSGD